MHNLGQSRPLLEDNSTAPDSEAQNYNAPESKYPDKKHGLLDYYILFFALCCYKSIQDQTEIIGINPCLLIKLPISIYMFF